MTSPTRSPVNGPGPDADRDRGQVLPDDPGVARGPRRSAARAARRASSGAPTAARPPRPLAVVERDGHERRGRVEGEEHGFEATERATHASAWSPAAAAPVVDEVEGEAGRRGVPDGVDLLGVCGTVETTPPPISSGRPANVVAPIVCACPTRVATTCGWRSSTAARSSPSISRIGSISSSPIVVGGWWRQTNVGVVRSAELTIQPGQLVRPEPPLVDPLPRDGVDQRVQHHEPEAVGRSTTVRASTPSPSTYAVAHVVVARAHRERAGPAVEPGPGLGVLLRRGRGRRRRR